MLALNYLQYLYSCYIAKRQNSCYLFGQDSSCVDRIVQTFYLLYYLSLLYSHFCIISSFCCMNPSLFLLSSFTYTYKIYNEYIAPDFGTHNEDVKKDCHRPAIFYMSQQTTKNFKDVKRVRHAATIFNQVTRPKSILRRAVKSTWVRLTLIIDSSFS